MEESRIKINPKKKRGPGRVKLTLGGREKLEKAAKSKERRNLNRQLGRAGMASKNKSKNPATGKIVNTKKKSSNIHTVSVLFVEQTKGGELARRLQKAELELGEKTGYRTRIVENAGAQLKRVFPSTNPWETSNKGLFKSRLCYI